MQGSIYFLEERKNPTPCLDLFSDPPSPPKMVMTPIPFWYLKKISAPSLDSSDPLPLLKKECSLSIKKTFIIGHAWYWK